MKRAAIILLLLTIFAGCSRLAYVDRQLGHDHLKKPLIRVRVYDGNEPIVLGADGSFVLRTWLKNGGKPSYYSISPIKIKVQDGLMSFFDTHGNMLERGMVKAVLVPRENGNPLEINGKRFKGVLEIYPDGSSAFAVVNTLNVEDYLKGVLPPEIGKRAPNEFEALKAQAVAARTYALATKDKYPGKQYDLINDIRDQVYTGISGESKATNRAINQTRGQAIMYRGELIEAYYHSTCAGQTENIEEVWNREPLPYLRSVTDLDYCKWSKFYDWNEVFEPRELLEHIRTYLADNGGDPGKIGNEIRELTIVNHTGAGRVRSVRLTTEKGNVLLRKDQIRWAFGRSSGEGIMRSTNFRLDLEYDERGVVSKVHLTGYGYGHGLGMCQCGAIGMARAGFDYKHIITHYYSNTRIRKLY
jgi:stage II sporulation protein D